MPSAARVGDPVDFMQVPPATGVVLGPGTPTVLIGMLPAAGVGDSVLRDGRPDAVVTGSATVLSAGRPAARVGDTTASGGRIVQGSSSVSIGG